MKALTIFVVIVCSLALAAVATAADYEQPLTFLRALQENGYGDVAVDYLKTLAQRRDLPTDIRDVWDLEMAKSLEAAAATAFDTKEKDALLADSQKHLAKFIKEKADRPEATAAMLSWGEFLAKRAVEILYSGTSGSAKDSEQSAKQLADARAGLVAAAEKYGQARQKLEARLDQYDSVAKLPAKRSDRSEAAVRERLEEELYQCDAQLALLDYYLAQTYSDLKSQDRIDALKKAAQALDDVYQRSRGSYIGLNAKLWHGKAKEELGDFDIARDVFDELLVNESEKGDRSPATDPDPLYAQAQRFRLSIIAKRQPDQFFPEAIAWLSGYRRFRQTEGYRGAAMDTVQAALAAATEMPSPERTKLLGELLSVIGECCKVRGPYAEQLALLRREILQALGRDLTPNNFEEAVSLGSAAADSGQWQQAMSAYRRAEELAAKKKPAPEIIADLREKMARVQYSIARDLLDSGKPKQCAEMVAKLVLNDKGKIDATSAAAAQAAALGVAARLELYREANDRDKPAALEKFMQAADFTEKNWPDRPEADDARMARGQAKFFAGQIREALDVFERVNPKSERYAAALYWAGRSYWQLYMTDKLKAADATAETPEMAANRAKALERLKSAQQILQRRAQPGRALPPYLLETQLFLADINLLGGEAREAAALYRPLVEALKDDASQPLNATAVRVFVNAMRACCLLKEVDQAASLGQTLIERGPDAPAVNEALIACASLLNAQRKQDETEIASLKASNKVEELKAAEGRLAKLKKTLGETLAALSRRQQLSLAQVAFVGEALNSLGMAAQGAAVLQGAANRLQAESDSGKGNQAAMARLRTQLAKSLRIEGKFDEALKEVDRLIADNPRDLEPLLEKGRILQDWAEKDHDRFDAAVSHWSTVRMRLQGMPRKPDGYYGVYYDVMYRAAHCLVRQAETSGDKSLRVDRAKKAEQLLKASLVLSPKLNGPETVEKYQNLLAKAITLQGRSAPKTEKKGGKP